MAGVMTAEQTSGRALKAIGQQAASSRIVLQQH